MSYTNRTTHYEIPLPTQNDLVNGLDWNTSSEAIDTAIYEASQAASTAAGDIVDIKQDIVDLKAEDVSIKEAATELTGRVGTLEQNATLDEAAIQDAFDMITDTEVTQAQSDVEIAEGQWFRYNGVLYVATTAIHIDDPIVPNTNCRATNIEDEMPSGGSVTASDVSYSNTASGMTADDVQEAIDELKGLIDQIGGNVVVTRYIATTQQIAASSGADVTVTFNSPIDLTKTSVKLPSGRGTWNATGGTSESFVSALKEVTTTGCVVQILNGSGAAQTLSTMVEVIEY